MGKIWPLILAMLVSGGALGQTGKTPVPSGARCLFNVGAKYVAGYPYVPQRTDGRPKQASGRLLVDTRGIAFCSNHLQAGGWPMPSVPPPACEDPACAQQGELSPIPYENISVLARGRTAAAGGLLQGVAAVAAPVVSLAALIASITTTGATRDWLLGGTLGSAGLAVGMRQLLIRRGNYIAVFFGPRKLDDTQDSPCDNAQTKRAVSNHPTQPPRPGVKSAVATPPKAPDLFYAARGCDVAIFQLFNPHDYWNISMILSARTGREFVAESAEQK